MKQDTTKAIPASIDATLDLLAGADYLADLLARHRAVPGPQDGPADLPRRRGRRRKDRDQQGAGPTLRRRLIRLQCYEGLDVTSAVYEWNYADR